LEISKGLLRKNREINSPKIRLIGADDKQIGVVDFTTALSDAQALDLDLVEVVPGREGEPPVCKIMDYGKYLYQQRKNLDAARKHQHQSQIKEVRFTPRIGEGDYQVKLRSIVTFLNNGDKVKVTIRFRGRELAYKEHGIQMLQRVEQETLEVAAIEQAAKFEGKQMMMVLSPKKKNPKAQSA
jgi:translation initiation factor IF-3